VTELLSPAQVAAGWTEVESAAQLQHIRPLSDAAHRFISETRDTRRVDLGFSVFDAEMRGIGPGHLAMLVGYSHSGKTLVMLNTLAYNHDRFIIVFAPDEPAPLVLIKLAGILWQVPARELEARVADDERTAIELIHRTVEYFPNLIVIDAPLSQRTMRAGFEEAREHWGHEGDLVVVDYLDLMRGGDLILKANAVKEFCMEFEVPTLVLHQTSRSAGSRGQVLRIDSGNFGGETWATYQLGVRRKKVAIEVELMDLRQRRDWQPWIADRISALEYEARVHEYTVTINLNKNKRPGGRLVGERDFELELDTGVLRPLGSDLPHQFLRRQTLRVVRDPDDDEREATW
jgi:replicative DNA helicase